MKNLIFHKLTGVRGWSYLDIDKIDIARVKSIDYYTRLFCIIQQEYPFTLSIKYHLPKETLKLMPGYCTNGNTIYQYQNVVKSEHIITKRYRSEEEVIKEIGEITAKKEKLEKWIERKRANIIKKMNELDELDELDENDPIDLPTKREPDLETLPGKHGPKLKSLKDMRNSRK